MKGIIIINPYLIPKESVKQADRLKEEFDKLNIKTEIITDGYLRAGIFNNTIDTDLEGCDFAIYLDKDKYLSNLLTKKGITLFNSHDSIRVCDDKGETYIALSSSGLNIPDTVFGALCYDKNAVTSSPSKYLINKLGLPIIVKESFGSMGKGVYLANNETELDGIIKELKTKPHLFQKYIGYKKGVDVRVIVVGGKAVASMERRNEHDFRSNIALGGTGYKIELPSEFKSAAEKAAKVVGLSYCGVDLLYGENGKPYICEVNSNAFFNEMEKVSGVNVAKIYAEYVVNFIKNKSTLQDK